MFSRPLVPGVCATIAGILVGHCFLNEASLPVFLFPSIILLCLGTTFVIPPGMRTVWLIAIFSLVGINSQINRPTLALLPHIFDKADGINGISFAMNIF